MKDIVVIGAGFGGLSAACLLAKQGHQVTLLEKNDQPGGRAMMKYKDGYSFDMGPSWYLMPEIFERFFGFFDKKPSDYYQLTKLDPSYRIYFGPGDVVDISANLEDNLKLFDELEEDGAQKLKDYLKVSQELYEMAVPSFVNKEYRKLSDFITKEVLEYKPKLSFFRNLDRYVQKTFTSDKAKKILEYSIVFLGGDPKNTPALYSLMSHVDFNLGVWYPQGGMHAVAEGMYALAKELEVDVKFRQEVKKIDIDAGKKIVRTNDQEFLCDITVVNADYRHAETVFLDEEFQTYNEGYWQKRTVAPSGFVIYLGVDKALPELKHHTLFFNKDWTKHFDQIFKAPDWPDAPSYYVCNPSKTDTNVAPEGHENLFFLVPVAAGLEDNQEIRQKFGEMILQDFQKQIGVDLSEHIVIKEYFAHNDFKQHYNAFKGTALGLSHTMMQTAYFRPGNRSKKVDGLFYVGQFTNPGIGVPMVMLSGEIVANIVKNEYEV